MQNGSTWEDYDGDTVSFVLVDDVSDGTLTLDSGTGDFTYTPSSGFVGDDSFTYELSDGTGTSTYTAIVDINVYNSVPEPSDDSAYTIHDQDAIGNVASNDNLMQNGSIWEDYDGDTVSFVLVDDVSDGTLALDSGTGDFTYTPNTAFVGDDLFTYELSDGLGTSTYIATVFIAVMNNLPEPIDDGFMIQCRCDDPAVKTGNVADNDSGLVADGDNWKDSDGDSVTFVLVDNVSSGALTFDAATGEFKYVQNEGFIGDDSFTYRITDGVQSTVATATVSLSVVGKTVPATPPTIQGTLTLDGSSTASGTANSPTTPDADLWYAIGYIKQYDGPTEFTADYTINLNPDGTFNATGSTITFKMVNYTDWTYITRPNASVSAADEAAYIMAGKRVVRVGGVGGKCFIYSNESLETTPAFTTVAIPITEVTIVNGRLQFFKFVGATWYTNPPAGLTDKGITGEIDLAKCKGTFTAKYLWDDRDTIATYVTEGKLK
jgi:hypothetical protein